MSFHIKSINTKISVKSLLFSLLYTCTHLFFMQIYLSALGELNGGERERKENNAK